MAQKGRASGSLADKAAVPNLWALEQHKEKYKKADSENRDEQFCDSSEQKKVVHINKKKNVELGSVLGSVEPRSAGFNDPRKKEEEERRGRKKKKKRKEEDDRYRGNYYYY
ncbi:hypothetical protein SLEP1_g57973 [Rubroshorea leprosula]|uniref:CBF1-interacting co-repressor CIR N-terminal domain-containing protein n=1 Tax=Rubroshorea leprosula TaxID=152421 RepID=A0AAV5MNY5_9ROSI|nr:hypothetical protein SLEP1_g57973 [Rubroshorea leprosula]